MMEYTDMPHIHKITNGWARINTNAAERGSSEGPKWALRLWARLVRGVVHDLEDCTDDEVEPLVNMAAAMRLFNHIISGCQPGKDGKGAGYAMLTDEVEQAAQNLLEVIAESEYHMEPPQAKVWRDESNLLHLAWWGTWTEGRCVELVLEHDSETRFQGDVVTCVIIRWDTGTGKPSSYLGLPHGLKESWVEDWGTDVPAAA